jgi:DNA repair ATPase RecN
MSARVARRFVEREGAEKKVVLSPAAKATAKTAAEKLSGAAHEFNQALAKLDQWSDVIAKILDEARGHAPLSADDPKIVHEFEWRVRQLKALTTKAEHEFDAWKLVYAAHDVADKLT